MDLGVKIPNPMTKNAIKSLLDLNDVITCKKDEIYLILFFNFLLKFCKLK